MAAFFESKHVSYIIKVAKDKESFEYEVSQHFHMSGMYWGLTALSLLGRDISQDLDVPTILEWVMSCQHPNGGFSGSPGHDSHILYTLSALQV